MLVRDLQRRRAGRNLSGDHAGDVCRNRDVVRARMHRLVDERFDAVEAARGLRRAGPAAAAFDVPLEIEVRPVKAGDQWIDHRSVLPGRQEFRARRCRGSAGRRARRCAHCRASGRNPAVPRAGSAASACRSRAGREPVGSRGQELAAPNPHVRAEVDSPATSRAECSSRTRARNPARPSGTSARRRCAASRASSGRLAIRDSRLWKVCVVDDSACACAYLKLKTKSTLGCAITGLKVFAMSCARVSCWRWMSRNCRCGSARAASSTPWP